MLRPQELGPDEEARSGTASENVQPNSEEKGVGATDLEDFPRFPQQKYLTMAPSLPEEWRDRPSMINKSITNKLRIATSQSRRNR